VKLGARVHKLEFRGAGHRVHYREKGAETSLTARHVWSTIPITGLARLAGPDTPGPVQAAARSLQFRGMLLVYLVLKTGQFTAYDAHYFPGDDIRITRLSEPKNYSGRVEPADVTVLCAELPCQEGDGTWQLDDRELAELVKKDLAHAGMAVNCPVQAVHVKRLPKAYPLYPLGFEEHFDRLDAWAESLPNVLTFGRQGLYAHDNTHHALAMAHAAVGCLRANGDFDRAQWERARLVFADHVVED
jgi:protoporphyrinogen oxidase